MSVFSVETKSRPALRQGTLHTALCVGGHPVPGLHRTHRALLRILTAAPFGSPVSYSILRSALQPCDSEVAVRRIHMYIAQLRRMLTPHGYAIVNVRHLGYRLMAIH